MRDELLILSLVGAVLGAPARAHADDDGIEGAEPRLITPTATPAPTPFREPRLRLSHKGQVQVSLRAALGLRAIVPYQEATYCGGTDSATGSGFAPVCAGRAPFSVDLELGYGIGRRADLLIELRIGLESDFGVLPGRDGGPRIFHVSPGARFFFSDVGRTKLFTTAQLVLDTTGYADPGGQERGTDLGVRNLSGLWFDLDPAYGIYAFIGETATFARWLRFELEAGVGIQGRYP